MRMCTEKREGLKSRDGSIRWILYFFENCFRQPFRKLVNKNKNLQWRESRKNSWKLVSWKVNGRAEWYRFQSIKKEEVIVSLLVTLMAMNLTFDVWYLDRFRRSKIFYTRKKIFSSEFELEWDRWRCEVWYKKWECDSCLCIYILICITVSLYILF